MDAQVEETKTDDRAGETDKCEVALKKLKSISDPRDSLR
jgi:hypothetical protein